MLLVAVPLGILALVSLWVGFSTRVGIPLMLLGVLLLTPMLWVLDQGWVVVRLTPAGFTVRRAGSNLSVAWDEVERFYIRQVPALFGSGKLASVQFRDSEPTFPRNRRALAGYIMAVGMDPEAEVELLERWRRLWSGHRA